MLPTRALRAAQHRTPLIKFLGKRTPPKSVDHTPHVHPASPTSSLPESFTTDTFASYRSKVTQHGPLNRGNQIGGFIGGRSGHELGDVRPAKGQFFDRDELPKRFQRMGWTLSEIEAVESGGASLW